MSKSKSSKSKSEKRKKLRDEDFPREGLIDLINYLREMLDENGIEYDINKRDNK